MKVNCQGQNRGELCPSLDHTPAKKGCRRSPASDPWEPGGSYHMRSCSGQTPPHRAPRAKDENSYSSAVAQPGQAVWVPTQSAHPTGTPLEGPPVRRAAARGPHGLRPEPTCCPSGQHAPSSRDLTPQCRFSRQPLLLCEALARISGRLLPWA